MECKGGQRARFAPNGERPARSYFLVQLCRCVVTAEIYPLVREQTREPLRRRERPALFPLGMLLEAPRRNPSRDP